MKKTMDRCQGSTEVMAMGGYEHESLRKGIDVLCKDVHGRWSLNYVKVITNKKHVNAT